MQKEFRVGSIIKPHGVHGEFKVFSTTEDNARFKKLKDVIIRKGDKEFNAEVVSAKASDTDVILKIKGYDTPESIEPLRRADIFVTRENAIELEEGEYFVADLLGLKVYYDKNDDGDYSTYLGELTDVLQTGANDVYVVTDESGKDILIPVIDDCIKKVDIVEEYAHVHLLPGLLDL